MFKPGDVPADAALTAALGGEMIAPQVDPRATNPDGGPRHAGLTAMPPVGRPRDAPTDALDEAGSARRFTVHVFEVTCGRLQRQGFARHRRQDLAIARLCKRQAPRSRAHYVAIDAPVD